MTVAPSRSGTGAFVQQGMQQGLLSSFLHPHPAPVLYCTELATDFGTWGGHSTPSETQPLQWPQFPSPILPIPYLAPEVCSHAEMGMHTGAQEVGSHLQPSKDLGLRPGPSLSAVPCELRDPGLAAQPFGVSGPLLVKLA